MLLKGLICFLMGFFFLGLIVIYELSLFDKDLDTMLKKFKQQKAMEEFLSQNSRESLPNIIIIKQHEPNSGLTHFRRFRQDRHRQHHRLHASQPFVESLMESERPTSRPLSGRHFQPTKAFERSKDVFGSLNKERFVPASKEVADKEDIWNLPEANETKQDLRVEQLKDDKSNDKLNIEFHVNTYPSSEKIEKQFRKEINDEEGGYENFEFEQDPVNGGFRPRTVEPNNLEARMAKVYELTANKERVGEIGKPFMRP